MKKIENVFLKMPCVLTALFLAQILLAGCFTVRSGYTPPIGKWPIGVAQDSTPKSITIFCGSGAACPAHILRAYNQSHLFSEVKNGVEGGELKASIDISYRLSPDYTGKLILPLLSFAIIPSVSSRDILITMTVTDSEGKKLGKLTEFEEVSDYFTSLAIPISFLTYTGGNVIEFDLTRAMIREAHERGIL